VTNILTNNNLGDNMKNVVKFEYAKYYKRELTDTYGHTKTIEDLHRGEVTMLGHNFAGAITALQGRLNVTPRDNLKASNIGGIVRYEMNSVYSDEEFDILECKTKTVISVAAFISNDVGKTFTEVKTETWGLN
jgi:hypothetical protein